MTTMTPHALRRTRYREWLAAQQLRWGFDAEIAAMADKTRGAVQNDTPPVERWHRILPTVRLAERLRDTFGVTTIHSAYRTIAYNAAIDGSATQSRHIEGDALDVSCATGTPADWAAALRALRTQGAFKGGVGVYDTFVHIDTRGVNADWTG
jgi:uncharacterized protein YcbK (DUF882 family)